MVVILSHGIHKEVARYECELAMFFHTNLSERSSIFKHLLGSVIDLVALR